MTEKCWMVRAGRKAQYLDEFREKSVVAIGWKKAGDLSNYKSQKEVLDLVESVWPDWNVGKQRMAASVLYRFSHDISVGNRVLSYDPQARVYLIGRIVDSYEYNSEIIEGNQHIRKVEWEGKIDRDRLSTSAKNSLGAISTLFRVPTEVNAEIDVVLATGNMIDEPEEAVAQQDENLLEDLEARAVEFIKDKVSRLDWDEMQELVAGVLRAMGYKTKVSPSGPDRGKDIVASPDGLGFENPRIVVEVKHRKEAIGAPGIRSFLGGRHPGDKGLYVSTRGFTKDAHYEAERANIPLTLMNMDDLVEVLIEHYENMDMESQRLVPLTRIHWPV